MREIVQLQVGQCGNNIGSRFWEIIADEHGIDSQGYYRGESVLQEQRLNVFFSGASSGKHVPRAILVDSQQDSLNGVKAGVYGAMYKPESFICNEAEITNNWARGHLNEGAQLADKALEVTRREVEACDLLHGFQMIHAIGGGTGGGVGSLIAKRLQEEYPDRIIASHLVLPMSKTSDVIIEPYNACFTLQLLIDATQEAFCMDNESLYQIVSKKLRIVKPDYADMNFLIARCMAGLTASLRFPGQLNSNLRKLYVNMVPFPRLHFFVPGYVPITSRSAAPYQILSVPELAREMFNGNNMFCQFDPDNSYYLTVASMFRGLLSTKEVEQHMANMQYRHKSRFVNWMPNCVKIGICDIPARGVKICATSVFNTTGISQSFERILESFRAMFQRRAFVHFYVDEGMDDSDFVQAQESLQTLIQEYRDVRPVSENDQDSGCEDIDETEGLQFTEDAFKENDQAGSQDGNSQKNDQGEEDEGIAEKIKVD